MPPTEDEKRQATAQPNEDIDLFARDPVKARMVQEQRDQERAAHNEELLQRQREADPAYWRGLYEKVLAQAMDEARRHQRERKLWLRVALICGVVLIGGYFIGVW